MTSKCGKNKKWHTRRSRVCHWCSYHILTSSVIYYLTDAGQHGMYLFYITKKLKCTKKESLFISNFATLTDTKIALWRDLLSIQNEANWLIAMLSKELWLVQRITQYQIWIEHRLSWKRQSGNLNDDVIYACSWAVNGTVLDLNTSNSIKNGEL